MQISGVEGRKDFSFFLSKRQKIVQHQNKDKKINLQMFRWFFLQKNHLWVRGYIDMLRQPQARNNRKQCLLFVQLTILHSNYRRRQSRGSSWNLHATFVRMFTCHCVALALGKRWPSQPLAPVFREAISLETQNKSQPSSSRFFVSLTGFQVNSKR